MRGLSGVLSCLPMPGTLYYFHAQRLLGATVVALNGREILHLQGWLQTTVFEDLALVSYRVPRPNK